MEGFKFHNPTRIIFGKNRIVLIGSLLKEYGYHRVLFLAGQGSIKKNGVYQKVAGSLKKAGIEWVELWGVKPNPVLSKVYEGIELARKEKVEAILAVGGGSVIDSAKAIAGGFYLKDIWEAFEGKVKIQQALPIFTVLTLSATASEMNQWAVVTKSEEKKKWAIGAEVLFPVASIIDPLVQMSLPWNQTVNGAIDALSHIMENYFVGKDQETSLAIEEALMRTIILETDRLQANSNDYNARANLVWAITMAHNGISAVGLKGGDWSAHRIEHGISAEHPEIAHGAGLAVVFPAWIQYMEKYNQKTFLRWAKKIWNARTIETAVKKMKTKYSKWGAPISLRQLGISEAEIKAIAQNAYQIGSLGLIKKLTLKDIEKILKLAL